MTHGNSPSGAGDPAQPEQQQGSAAPAATPVGDQGRDAGDGGGEAALRRAWAPPRRSVFVMILIAMLAALAALAVLAAWRLPPFASGEPRSDDAYVRADTTTISPEVTGYVSQVAVRDYDHVRAGQLLVVIDDSSARARVAQAQAGLDQARSQLANNRQQLASARAGLEGKRAALGSARAQHLNTSIELARADDLVTDGSVSARERDQADTNHRQTLAGVRQAEADVGIAAENVRSVQVGRGGLAAQVAQARAQLNTARIELAHTRISAPVDGQLGEVNVRVGAYVANGTQLFSLVPAARWINANYKEAETRDIRVGQHATFRVDALGGLRFRGVVEHIAPATGSEFSLIRTDNATGNFVKVPQRIGVQIAIPANQPGADRLRPGMSVETWIDTTPGAGPVDRPR